MITAPRWQVLASAVAVLIIGIVVGLGCGRAGRVCETVTVDQGMTYSETCVRDVTP